MKIQIPKRGILTCYLKILVVLFEKSKTGHFLVPSPGVFCGAKSLKKGNLVSLR